MALPRYRANNTPKPSGSSPSPASASGSTGADSSPASQNSGAPVPGVLLGLSGSWLVARIFLFGGSLWLLEIIAMVAMAGFSHSKGGKVQKRVATAIIAVALLNLFVPGINPWIKSLRESQLNPPPPTEQSAGQGQVATAPATVEEIPSTERVIISGKRITLTGDGIYSVPAGKKSLCFENLGMKDGSSTTSQYLTINGVEYSALGTKCLALDENLSGEITVDFFPGRDYGTPKGLQKLYTYWSSQTGGQAEWPVIRIGE